MTRMLGAAALVLLMTGCAGSDAAGPSIQVTKVQTIAGPAEDGGFVGFTMVSPRTRRGERIAWSMDGKRWPPLVIDSTGAVIDTFAVYGDGPGELNRPTWILDGPGDSLLVFDAGRIAVFDPDLKFARVVPVAARYSWAVTRFPGTTLVTSSASFGDTVPIVAYDLADGTQKWAIGVPPVVGQSPSVRSVRVGPDGSLWAVRSMQKLELTQYDSTGKFLRTLAPVVPWFPPYENYANPSRETAPSPYVVGFWIDPLDRAWIVGQMPDPEWATAEGEDRPAEGGSTYFVPTRPEDVRDGVIEVIDLKTGTSVARIQNDSLYGFVVEPWILARPRITEDGWQQLDLYRVGAGAGAN